MFNLRTLLISLVLISQPGCGCDPAKQSLEQVSQKDLEVEIKRNG